MQTASSILIPIWTTKLLHLMTGGGHLLWGRMVDLAADCGGAGGAALSSYLSRPGTVVAG